MSKIEQNADAILCQRFGGHIDTMAGSIAERAPRKGDGSPDPSDNELPIACCQGRHVVEMTQEWRI
ncbi:hypothetical protein F6A13_14805 [Acidithiobacillus sp. 'AMD consortium']|uniref:Uncharacterized protein n=2 Tax=Acidithiobacillus ferridurans TaxID=1232575 RepID=A0A2Z6IMJ4_ACIFI|nr:MULTISPECIES: hypothetical protein [Acidithiobacillus]MBU2715485.1 hypothetical protein [Acidithiobacillus ferridurans]MBU2720339.1 hypothetical protein [Acidithiobacillus ferridurans]MBU2725040.1 hypothetical protein [Acidithiobacillus ferridurans]MBU2727195.1 hypothetical protein [Acidithiobacillus ferridurans]QFG79736.1 hypothetical protein F6A13_14805 [Acidithiobacillus sp. 'AMD consortium']